MTPDDNLYPMEWPCGHLEVALRRRLTRAVTEEVNANLLKWSSPESLTVLRGTPINCLIVPWAAGLVDDEEQQRHLQPLLVRARALGLQIVGRASTLPQSGRSS